MLPLSNSEQFHWFDHLGGGAGPSRVRKIQHKYNNQISACKQIIPDPSFVFDIRCVDAVARSNHRNIVQVSDRWTDQWPTARVYIQMELCYGDLNQYIEANRQAGQPINHTELWGIMADLVDGLIYAHEMGWSHQNLKPRNILAKQNGTNAFGRPQFTWKICDWGIAPICLPPPTPDDPQTHIATSDDVYRAPEHRHYRTTAVDIWSLGCILFELATNGVLAFPVHPDDPTYSVENGKNPVKIATMKTPQVTSDPHGHINRVLTGCLNPDPANRPTARQLGTYIAGILGRS